MVKVLSEHAFLCYAGLIIPASCHTSQISDPLLMLFLTYCHLCLVELSLCLFSLVLSRSSHCRTPFIHPWIVWPTLGGARMFADLAAGCPACPGPTRPHAAFFCSAASRDPRHPRNCLPLSELLINDRFLCQMDGMSIHREPSS